MLHTTKNKLNQATVMLEEGGAAWSHAMLILVRGGWGAVKEYSAFGRRQACRTVLPVVGVLCTGCYRPLSHPEKKKFGVVSWRVEVLAESLLAAERL